VSSKRRIQARLINVVKVTVKFIRKGIYHDRIRVERNGGKGKNISSSPCRKWEWRLKMLVLSYWQLLFPEDLGSCALNGRI
jgi:hypothetical protein